MKSKHVASARLNARQVLQLANISLGQDFYTLSSSQVDILLAEAKRVRYQRPKNANGSTGRYFHDRLQRLAKEPKS